MSFNKQGVVTKAELVKPGDVKKVAAQFDHKKDEPEKDNKKADLKKPASKE